MKVLAGDIGGTNTRLQLCCYNKKIPEVIYQNQYKGAEFNCLSDILYQFIAQAGSKPSEIAACAFAVAGPVIEGTVHLTNLPWVITNDELSNVINSSHVALINDFEAIGYGIETLKNNDIHTLQKGFYQSTRPVAIIGAGTGIGMGMVIYHKGDTIVCPTEGGHVDFPPVTEEQIDLLRFLRSKYHRVSLERICCGTGLVNIYQYAIKKPIYNQQESPAMKRALARSYDKSATITYFALEKKDPVALRALDIFIQVYGASAGNLALTTLPYQGLYIVGGIAPKLKSQLEDGRFMKMFLDKGRMSDILYDVPVHICLNTEVGLQGARQYAAKMLS